MNGPIKLVNTLLHITKMLLNPGVVLLLLALHHGKIR
jgi:hypothetical protein